MAKFRVVVSQEQIKQVCSYHKLNYKKTVKLFRGQCASLTVKGEIEEYIFYNETKFTKWFIDLEERVWGKF